VNDNKLGFGLMRLPVHNEDITDIDMDEFKKMVDAFMDKGYNYFDTAYPYHLGASEKAVKEAIVERYPRESFLIADKLPTFVLQSADQMEPIFNEQLERCGVEYFDYYLLHNLSTWTKKAWDEIDSFSFIKKMKEEGKIRKIGFSFHDNAELLDEVLNKHPEVEFVQLQINYLDWENESIQARQCYEICEKHNVPVIVMEPLKGGTIINIPEEAKDLLKNYNPDASIVSWAFRFFKDLDNVERILTGASNLEQMEENLNIMENIEPLNSDEKEITGKVVEILNGNNAIPCTKCNYCIEECPMNIPIPTYFELFNNEKELGFEQFSAQQVYYRTYALTEGVGMASECTQCEACVSKCPQHLDIPTYMEEVYDRFEKTMNEF
jgi:predicted aldo/keto reductase-like oxidoreductase